MTALEMDLTPLIEDRVHLAGFDCAALRALRAFKEVFSTMPYQRRQFHIEFWEHSNSNPSKVKCLDCWNENAEVKRAFERDHGPRRIVVDLRRHSGPRRVGKA